MVLGPFAKTKGPRRAGPKPRKNPSPFCHPGLDPGSSVFGPCRCSSRRGRISCGPPSSYPRHHMAPSSSLEGRGEGEGGDGRGEGARLTPPPPTNRPARVRTKNRQPARTTPKPTGRPGCAPKTGNQRAPSSGATSLFQDPPFLDKYAGNKKITMARVAVTRPAVSPSNARKPVVVFGLCLCLWRHPMAPQTGRLRA